MGKSIAGVFDTMLWNRLAGRLIDLSFAIFRFCLSEARMVIFHHVEMCGADMITISVPEQQHADAVSRLFRVKILCPGHQRSDQDIILFVAWRPTATSQVILSIFQSSGTPPSHHQSPGISYSFLLKSILFRTASSLFRIRLDLLLANPSGT